MTSSVKAWNVLQDLASLGVDVVFPDDDKANRKLIDVLNGIGHANDNTFWMWGTSIVCVRSASVDYRERPWA